MTYRFLFRRLLTGVLLCCGALRLSAQTDTTLVDSRGDTLLLRKTASAWHWGIRGSAAVGINTGLLSLQTDVNKSLPRAGFAGHGFGDASAWALSAEATWQSEQGGVRYGGRVGFTRQTALVAYTPLADGDYGLLQSNVEAGALVTGLFALLPLPALMRCVMFGGVEALWSLGAQANTTKHFRPEPNDGTATVPARTITFSEAVVFQTPALSLSTGIGYTLHSRDVGAARVHTTPFLEGVWQPLLSGANGLSWGAFMLRAGISVAIEPLRVDTLSVQPLIRWLPIVQLTETPFASRIDEEQAVTGRIASARENRDAVLEERVVIYRPDESALLHGVPPEALEILRAAVPLLLSRARCRLILTVPAASDRTNTTRAETTLGLLVDYLLRRGIEEASIEAGIGENRFLSGEALQLRIRVARDVR